MLEKNLPDFGPNRISNDQLYNTTRSQRTLQHGLRLRMKQDLISKVLKEKKDLGIPKRLDDEHVMAAKDCK